MEMKALLISFVVGLLVGVLYGLIRVKSPAPPIVALLGLLGMVLGEQAGEWLLTKKIQAANVAAPHIVGERKSQEQRSNVQSVMSPCIAWIEKSFARRELKIFKDVPYIGTAGYQPIAKKGDSDRDRCSRG
jgi:XapX domain-containing protein